MKLCTLSPDNGRFRLSLTLTAFLALPLVLTPIGAASHASEARPSIQRVVSPGGVIAWLRETRHAPSITFNISFRGGAWHDPLGKSGLAQVAAYMFNEGAGRMKSREILGELHRKAITLGADSSAEYFTINFSTPLIHRKRAVELLRLALYSPRFDAEPLAQAKRKQLAQVRAKAVSPFWRGISVLEKTLLVDPKLTRAAEGTPSDLKAITVTDIAAFRSKTLTRDTIVIGVAGAISARELAPMLDRLFGDLPLKSGHASTPLPPELRNPRPDGDEHRSARYQSISADIGHSTVLMRNVLPRIAGYRQRAAAQIANFILGGRSNSRLFTEIRERQGLVYGINTALSSFDRFEVFGLAFATGQGAPSVRTKVLAMLREFATTGPTAEEFRSAKRAFRGMFHFSLMGNANLASILVGCQLRGEPITVLDDFNRDLASITRADVAAAARNLIRPDTMVIVTVGPQRPAAVPGQQTSVVR